MKLLKWLPRFQTAYRSLAVLESREQWSRAEIEAFQLERLNRLWASSIQNVPYYREMATEKHLPRQFRSLEEYQALVPVLPKSVVRGRKNSILSEHPDKGHWGRTGGSTGAPMSNYWGKEAHLEMLRCKYRFQAMWGIDIFDPMAFLWGHSASFKPGWSGRIARWWQPFADWLRNRLRFSAYRLGQDDLQSYVRHLCSSGARALYGYSSAIYLLAQQATAMASVPEGLRLVILTGEPAYPHLVEGIEGRLRVPAVIEYGSIECGFLAGEGPDRKLRAREDVVFLESQSREDGRYDILVTVLNNPSFPLLRYAIDDVTDHPIERPDRGFAILKNVSGRSNDLIITQTGRVIHSARFDAFFKYEAPGVRRFHIHQQENGSLDVAIELERHASLSTDLLARRLEELVEGYPVRVSAPPAFPQTAAGKHRLVLSDLNPENYPRPHPLPKEMSLQEAQAQ